MSSLEKSDWARLGILTKIHCCAMKYVSSALGVRHQYYSIEIGLQCAGVGSFSGH